MISILTDKQTIRITIRNNNDNKQPTNNNNNNNKQQQQQQQQQKPNKQTNTNNNNNNNKRQRCVGRTLNLLKDLLDLDKLASVAAIAGVEEGSHLRATMNTQ